ncbi:MAG: RNA methyltransferase [Pirellulaceae bacterium]|jgi:RNA methyltransferase, TrmH family|nr:RNA methyltransferase [Pirellulaceae bacterium]
MIPITSSQNPKFKAALRLESSRGRKKQGRILINGIQEIQRALDAGVAIEEMFVCEGMAEDKVFGNLITSATEQGVQVYSLPKELLQKLEYGERSIGLVAIAKRPTTTLETLGNLDDGFVVVLEGTEKPGNVGAVARSADGAGARALLLADPCTDFFHPNAIRASVGTVFSLPLASGTSIEIVNWLQSHGFTTYSAIVDAQQDLWETKFPARTAIVLGNESEGLSEVWRTRLMVGVSLPMLGAADSLNVSTTAAIMAYEIARQRQNA